MARLCASPSAETFPPAGDSCFRIRRRILYQISWQLRKGVFAIFLRGGFLDVKGWRERCGGVVWQDYVAGTGPTNGQSKFTTKIEMKDGEPVVTVEMT